MCVSDPDVPEDEEGGTIAHNNLPPVPTPAELAPLFPDLEILELLGQGGMGAVYKARQRKLDRLVAIKILPSEWGCDPAFAERFAREARAMARLNHPHVVAVHDFGDASGHYFLIMEYVDGANLRQILATGRLQPAQALPLVAQICDALQYAHEQEIVHRDIKPENILIDKRGRLKIADFGLAKLLRRSRNEFTLTGSRQVMGTLDYMAPEQRTTPQAVDHRADIYSLGVVFYEMLTGELPLGRFAPPSEKAPVDGRLDEVVFRALEREPDRRYQRISAVKADVESILRADAWRPALAGSRGPWEPDFALVQLQTRGPAAGMAVVAFLIILQMAIAGIVIEKTWGHGTLGDLLDGWGWLGVLILAAAGLIVTGAVKFARCKGYDWVVIAIILMLLPLGYHFFLSLPIAIWALVVLNRTEVKAAFAHNMRRAARTAQPRTAPAAVEPLVVDPARPATGKVRGFFLSMFSMFAPRSTLGKPPAGEEAVAAQKPSPSVSAGLNEPSLPGARLRKPSRTAASLLGIGMGFCFVLGCLFLLYGIRSKGENWEPPSPPRSLAPRHLVLKALRAPDLDELRTTLPLFDRQPESLAKVLSRADADYLDLEARHTSRQVDKAGHLRITIGSFSNEVRDLEDRLRANLDNILIYGDQSRRLSLQMPHGKLFPYGMWNYAIEIWQTDDCYHWKEIYTGSSTQDGSSKTEPHGTIVEEGNGKQLPRKYQRFWKDRPSEEAIEDTSND
jgi:tRNA A-37 threonylcarbamoyl transferase component Bud32